MRAIVPGAIAVTVACLAFGADAGAGLALGVPALVAAVLAGAAETGSAFVQASAYGDERRLLLRPPLGYLAASVVSWMVWVTALLTAPLAWAARSWLLAGAATLVAVATSWLLPRRWHQLSRRWLVTVPAGLVVHDPVVLAETLMLPRRQVTSVGLAELGSGATDATDLTGPTPGLAVEIRLRDTTTARLARRPGEPQGRSVPLPGSARFAESSRCGPRRDPTPRLRADAAAEDVAVGAVVEHDALARCHAALGPVPADVDLSLDRRERRRLRGAVGAALHEHGAADGFVHPRRAVDAERFVAELVVSCRR